MPYRGAPISLLHSGRFKGVEDWGEIWARSLGFAGRPAARPLRRRAERRGGACAGPPRTASIPGGYRGLQRRSAIRGSATRLLQQDWRYGAAGTGGAKTMGSRGPEKDRDGRGLAEAMTEANRTVVVYFVVDCSIFKLKIMPSWRRAGGAPYRSGRRPLSEVAIAWPAISRAGRQGQARPPSGKQGDDR